MNLFLHNLVLWDSILVIVSMATDRGMQGVQLYLLIFDYDLDCTHQF